MNSGDSFADRVRTVDAEATELVSDGNVSWVRSRLGILGEVRIPDATPADEAPRLVQEQVARAHALLDELPLNRFRRSDVWNLLLFVCLPFDSTIAPDIRAQLETTSADLRGSRRLLLWRGQAVESQLAPVMRHLRLVSAPGDPLRRVVAEGVRDDVDARALELLFKRRLEEADIDELVRALGREIAT
jgi:hypothetical protein